jgi:hypothetical protein
MLKFLELLSSQSLMSRLLWPVNIISFILMFGFSLLFTFQHISTLKEAKLNRAQTVLNAFANIRENLIGTPQQNLIPKYESQSESDLSFVNFYDSENKSLSPEIDHADSADLNKIERELHDSTGKYAGKVVVGFIYKSLGLTFWKALGTATFCGILIQFLLSFSIFIVCRRVIEPLNLSLLKLSKTTNVLSKTSKAISGYGESISNGVHDQSDVVQNTTAAMSEMSSSLSQTNSYAKESAELMQGMTRTANNGMNIMNQMVDAMTSVHHANEQLEDMVQLIKAISVKTKVINDIVFKTQLLSFNASIEAARAGQHGRGFAVVAEEVGNLAKMSGQAATEISSILLTTESQVNEIVRNTSERIQVGRQVTEQALKNFKDISHEVDSISLRILNITEASIEQETTLEKTVSGMQGIHKTTEMNSEIAYQSSQAATLLDNETFNLQHISRSISRSIIGRVMSEQEMSSKNKKLNSFAFEKSDSQQKRAS